jgi:hypothetical protein
MVVIIQSQILNRDLSGRNRTSHNQAERYVEITVIKRLRTILRVSHFNNVREFINFVSR